MENFITVKDRIIHKDIDNISELNNEMSITTDVINKFFTINEILGDGNCLFNAISYALIGNQSMSNELRMGLYSFYKENPIYKRIKNGDVHTKIETIFYMSTWSDSEVDYVHDDKKGTYYRHADNRGDYKTMEEINTLGLDKRDYLDIKYRPITHIENIQNNGVFGSNGDVIAFCYLLEKNIIVIVQDRENKNYHRVTPFILNDRYDETIYLQLIGESHYQILNPRVRLASVPISTSPKSNRDIRNSRTPLPKLDHLAPRDTRKSESPTSKKVGSPRDTRKSKSPTSKRVGSPRDTRKSESPTSKKVGSPRDTRKSKSPSRSKTIKIDRDEKKLQELFQTHEDLQQSINELETLLGKLTEHKDTDNASQVNNELKRQKLVLKQIEKKIHEITGTEFSIFYEIRKLLGIQK